MNVSRRTALGLPLLASGFYFAATTASAATTDRKHRSPMPEDLQQDAEAAWRYFTATTAGRKAGLHPAAVWPQGQSFGRYSTITMWDVGSLVLALVSARSLELISSETFDVRVQAVMKFLKRSRFSWKGARLPNYRSHVETQLSIEAGYDATDMGRLLLALHVLDQTTAKSYDVKAIIEKWDIDKTIKDGALHDIKFSKILPNASNNYRYYVSRAHRLWGFDVDRGYDGELSTDGARNEFIEGIQSVGAVATEPSANEIIELGHSPHADLLSDIIYNAQRDRYIETGQLTAVSEAPIDSRPWFTYQGYDRNGYGTFVWPVHSAVTEKQWQTEEFAKRFRMVNTKAAFLWFAVRTDAYARKLRAFASSEAQTGSLGFVPGIYESSGTKPKLMDINTNALVLESLAYVANDRRPLVDIRLT